MGKIKLSSKSSDLNYPAIKPTLNLNFAATKTLDPRITFIRNSIGTYVDVDGYIKTAVVNQPRFDHDPTTGKCLGLLVEEQRTNEITQSEAFNTWAGGSTLITSNIAGIVSPDGTSGNVDLWNGSNFIRSFSSSSTNRIISVYVKFTGNVGQFRIGSFGGNTIYTTFTISSTGVITANTPSVGTSISVGNGWYRVYMNIGTGNEHIIELVSGTPSLYLWGAQSEAGTFPTSYIPTSGSTVTRLADSATITGTNFSSWYNTSEGTLLSIGEEPSSYIISSSLNVKSNSSRTKTVSNLLYYPKTIQNSTLKVMNAYTSSYIITSGLVLYLDAGNIFSYSGTGTTWNDLSGRSNNGTLVNGVGYNSSNEGSLVFDGIDDFSVVSTLPTRDGIFTNEIVFYPTSLSGGNNGWSTLMFFSTSTLRSFYFIFNSSGAIGTTHPDATYTNDISSFSSNGLISINNWYHAVQILDKPNNILKMYLNGSLVVNVSPGTHTVTTTSTVTFAQQGIDPFSPFARRMAGRISNVKIYNRALTASEVQQNFNALRGRFGL